MNEIPQNIAQNQTVILDRETAAAIADMLNLVAETFNAPAYQCDPENITTVHVKTVVGLALISLQTLGNHGFGRS
jgi:hypothetical protein